MKSAIYIGPIQALIGFKALIQPKWRDDKHILAQFDREPRRPDEKLDGNIIPLDNDLRFGWHEFPKCDFQVVQ